jgi:hypothetical protein
LPGSELEPDNRLLVDLEPDRYRVRAAYKEDQDSWMILVQLQPITRSADVSPGTLGA